MVEQEKVIAPEHNFGISAEFPCKIASVIDKTLVVAITDSWFGNNCLWEPLNHKIGHRFDMISRLRSNSNLLDLPSESHEKTDEDGPRCILSPTTNDWVSRPGVSPQRSAIITPRRLSFRCMRRSAMRSRTK